MGRFCTYCSTVAAPSPLVAEGRAGAAVQSRSMGRVILAGAEPVDNWTSFAGALHGVLRFLGEPVTRPWVMGVSGYAFRLALPAVEGVVAAGPIEAAFDPQRTAALTSHLGWKVEIIATQPGGREYAKRRAEVIGRVHKSIDRGRPVVVYGLHLPRFGVVKGYDDRAGLWFVGSMLSTQYGEALPLDRWPVPERADPVLAVFLVSRTRGDPRRAVLAALQYALTYAAEGEPGDPTGAVHGRAAYRHWQETFAGGAPIAPAGNALLVHQLQSARRDAAAFLREDAARLLPAAAPALHRAAAAYDAEALALSRLVTLFPFPSGGDPDNPAARLSAAAALRQALAREEEALAALRAALAAVH
jgi:hypothetical protein